ncbi:MAG: aldo/keto reductase [Clostridiaceae bacterium]|nr:aldo/keto reductase [Clostridiaceae bacterium]
MNYRKLGQSSLMVSEIGLGCEHLQGLDAGSVKAVIDQALASGLNIMDVFMSEPAVRSNIGAALKGRRNQVVLQGHIGSVWLDGQYTRSRNLAQCREAFEDLLTRLQTDYIDIGMIHFVDTEDDYQRVFATNILPYALELKKTGKIKHLGFSSHNPVTALKIVKTGLFDVLMFSVNPAYDILPEDTAIDDFFVSESYQNDQLKGINPAREMLYRTCEAMGTAITVMKGLAAGSLLKAESSPFGAALTPVQCIHYALTRPAVASILVGCRTPQEVIQAAAYEEASETERDYSPVLSRTPKYSLNGKCMYCNHCLPCPSKIDIAQVNKYLDLVLAVRSENSTAPVPGTIREHYAALSSAAADCIACGSCESNCPFGVPVIERMRQAQAVFGK